MGTPESSVPHEDSELCLKSRHISHLPQTGAEAVSSGGKTWDLNVRKDRREKLVLNQSKVFRGGEQNNR